MTEERKWLLASELKPGMVVFAVERSGSITKYTVKESRGRKQFLTNNHPITGATWVGHSLNSTYAFHTNYWDALKQSRKKKDGHTEYYDWRKKRDKQSTSA